MREATHEAWMQSTPQRVRDPLTLQFVERMRKAFQASRGHRKALNELGSLRVVGCRMREFVV